VREAASEETEVRTEETSEEMDASIELIGPGLSVRDDTRLLIEAASEETALLIDAASEDMDD